MKKYKLIKKYPGSPELGTIAEKHGNNSIAFTYSSKTIYNSSSEANLFEKLIVNQPEFWEEVVEKEYEILSFSKTTSTFYIYTIRKNGRLLWDIPEYKGMNADKNAVHWTEAIEKGYNIHSVKRLSDGEVFTIGDRIQYYNITGEKSHTHVISDITIYENKILLNHNHGTWKSHGDFNKVQKVKQPLFTTEDGVEKDYKILSYQSKDKIIAPATNFAIEISKPGHWNIHSVRRLSDGEIFTIGDRVTYFAGEKYDFNITSIKEDHMHRMSLYGKESAYTVLCSKTKHNMPKVIKKPLFTTEDGVDIYKGDVVYRVSNSDGEIFKTPSRINTCNWYLYEENYEVKGQHPNHKHFSTKEKAEEYISMNKSKYSINDILASLPNKKCEKYISIKQMIENLKNM